MFRVYIKKKMFYKSLTFCDRWDSAYHSFLCYPLGVGGSILISIVSIPTLVLVSDRY